MSLKEKIINEIIEREAGYVNDPADSGGETNWGITERVARNFGYKGAMVDLPRETAFNIYASIYWDRVKADELVKLYEPLAAEVVDTQVNLPEGKSIRFLQRALNALNRGEKLYPDINVDGVIGNKTIMSVKAYLASRDGAVLVKALNGLQLAYYFELTERREKDERFLYGWIRNRT